MSRFECAVPPKILEENFPTGLVLISNQAKPQKEAAKCVLWIVHFLFFGKYTLLPPRHIAQLADEISVGAIRFPGAGSVKPCESNPLLCQRIVRLLDVKSCLDAQESQQRNTELFSYAPDERDLRRNQRDDSSGEAQGKRFSYL